MLTILCSLLLLGAQAMPQAAAVARPAAHDCGCGGRMACCQAAPVQTPPPLPVTAQVASQNLVLAAVPATAILVLPVAGNNPVFPTVSPARQAGRAPLFARHCAWLL